MFQEGHIGYCRTIIDKQSRDISTGRKNSIFSITGTHGCANMLLLVKVSRQELVSERQRGGRGETWGDDRDRERRGEGIGG